MTVETFLNSHAITYTLHEHPAVFTCEDAERHCGDVPGLACKNLFLTDPKKQRYFLLILPAHKRTDLKKFGDSVGEKRLSFASPNLLQEKLGLIPGAVSPFGLLNDTQTEVCLYIDTEVSIAPILNFHPNRNTASVALTQEMFRHFLRLVGHDVCVLTCQ